MRLKVLLSALVFALLTACGPGSTDPANETETETAAVPADYLGDWSAALKIPTGAELGIVLHIEAGEEEGFDVSLDVPEQGANGIPGADGRIDEDGNFRTEFPLIGASLNLDREGDELIGIFFQGIPLPVTFQQGVTLEKPARPQEDEMVRDYSIELVKFPGGAEGVTLAGEYTIPRGPGPFPAVVLISGSGAQDRNEELMDHKPFLILSDYLTNNGFAVLRYDDRGTASSTGKFSTATTQDFADDAAAALKFLLSKRRIDTDRAGYIGHSEGGFIAPLATKIEPADFMVFLAGPSQPLPDVILRQSVDLGKQGGATDAQLEKQTEMQTELFASLKDLANDEDAFDIAKEIISSSGLIPASAVDVQAKRMASPWMLWMIAFDPRPVIAEYDGPVLALFAEKDLQVAPDANVADMQAALTHPQSVVKTLPGLNHLFQPAETGAMTEYYEIEITFDEGAMEEIATWINGLD